jgi:hypothetical protein
VTVHYEQRERSDESDVRRALLQELMPHLAERHGLRSVRRADAVAWRLADGQQEHCEHEARRAGAEKHELPWLHVADHGNVDYAERHRGRSHGAAQHECKAVANVDAH